MTAEREPERAAQPPVPSDPRALLHDDRVRAAVRAALDVGYHDPSLLRDKVLGVIEEFVPPAPVGETERLRELERLARELGFPDVDAALAQLRKAGLVPVGETGDDAAVERAACAMALANDDGCFEDLADFLANCDHLSKEAIEEECASGEEDREYYRKLARAALAAAPSVGETLACPKCNAAMLRETYEADDSNYTVPPAPEGAFYWSCPDCGHEVEGVPVGKTRAVEVASVHLGARADYYPDGSLVGHGPPVPAGGEGREDYFYLCCNCGIPTPADSWEALRRDEDDRLVPAEGEADPILRCPACQFEHEDNDCGPGIQDAHSLEDAMLEHATMLADPDASWGDLWAERTGSPRRVRELPAGETRAHEVYASPVGGGWDGYRAACHDCNWTGSRVWQAKSAALLDAQRHKLTLAAGESAEPGEARSQSPNCDWPECIGRGICVPPPDGPCVEQPGEGARS